jgi:hypothetical protein
MSLLAPGIAGNTRHGPELDFRSTQNRANHLYVLDEDGRNIMNRQSKAGIFSAAVACGLFLDASTYAVPSYTVPGTWNEGAYYNGFGGPLPAGIVEGSSGFSTIGDYDGRTIALAGVTTNHFDSDPLTTINTGLFAGTDANLYAFAITNVSAFSVSVPNTSAILALFSSNGTALAASVGGSSFPINSSNAGITTPGIYYVGFADAPLYPQNNESQNIFGLTNTSTGVFTPAGGITDDFLSTNPELAWTLPTPTSPLLSNTSFVTPSSTITLTGSGFASVPEPASLGLLGVAGLSMLSRRRKLTR